MSFQSCEKSAQEPEVIIDYYTYAAKYNWSEDSIKTGDGQWVKVEKSNTFSWLSPVNSLQKSNAAVYSNISNIKTNFNYLIPKDSVFTIKLSSDTVYFIGANNNNRTDLIGNLTFSTDTSLVLRNLGVSPAVSIKYKQRK